MWKSLTIHGETTCSTLNQAYYCRSVVLNRGAAETLGAMKSSWGAANLLTCCLFTGKFSLGVPLIDFITKVGCCASKKTNTAVDRCSYNSYLYENRMFTNIVDQKHLFNYRECGIYEMQES